MTCPAANHVQQLAHLRHICYKQCKNKTTVLGKIALVTRLLLNGMCEHMWKIIAASFSTSSLNGIQLWLLIGGSLDHEHNCLNIKANLPSPAGRTTSMRYDYAEQSRAVAVGT